MTGNWEILETAFHEALRLDGGRREQFAVEFAKKYPELEAQLRALLIADDFPGTEFGDTVAAAVVLLLSLSR